MHANTERPQTQDTSDHSLPISCMRASTPGARVIGGDDDPHACAQPLPSAGILCMAGVCCAWAPCQRVSSTSPARAVKVSAAAIAPAAAIALVCAAATFHFPQVLQVPVLCLQREFELVPVLALCCSQVTLELSEHLFIIFSYNRETHSLAMVVN